MSDKSISVYKKERHCVKKLMFVQTKVFTYSFATETSITSSETYTARWIGIYHLVNAVKLFAFHYLYLALKDNIIIG